jgi:hypothetical protein
VALGYDCFQHFQYSYANLYLHLHTLYVRKGYLDTVFFINIYSRLKLCRLLKNVVLPFYSRNFRCSSINIILLQNTGLYA